MKTTLKEATQCPSCGKPIPAGALAGLCPACLLAQGADTDSGDGGGSRRFEPPPRAEIAKLFPQLEILDLLGAGGMGAVYKARQPALDRVVALKILPAKTRTGANFAERFNREARALARLSHPNIVGVHEFGQAGALHFFIMEFVDGANLRQLERAGRLAPREALQLIPQICDALQYAHDEGVVHRDIKPENVLVDRKGRVKIADFGLAKIIGQDTEALRLTREGLVMGTPHYMAPEQVERPLSVDHRADIYSLGVVLYEMLTGDLPIGKFSPPSRKVQVDVRFDEVVLRALENDPARRYQHASEVKSQVETITGTPGQPSVQSAAVTPAPGKQSVYWAGFALLTEQNGALALNRKETLRAWAILFGLLTIGFAFVTALTGHTLMGWLGLSGFPSLLVRVAVAALIVGVAARRALSRAGDEKLRHTPNGTVILVPRIPWWRSGKFVRASLMILAWCFFQTNWLTPWLRSRYGGVSVGQVATPDTSSGALVATLPNGGTMELLALADAGAAPNDFWQPDGTPLAPTTYEIKKPGRLELPGMLSKDLVFRFANLPNGEIFPIIESEPANSQMSGMSGHTVLRDGQLSSDTWPIRMAWPGSMRIVTLRLGISLSPWRTVASMDRLQETTTSTRQAGDPNWTVNFHIAGEIDGQAQVTTVRGIEDRNWQSRFIAVDLHGNEHADVGGVGISTGSKQQTWTAKFTLPLADVKEFRAQVRPLHWVDFRDVALRPNGAARPGQHTGITGHPSDSKAARNPAAGASADTFGPVVEKDLSELIDFDTGMTGGFPKDEAVANPFAGMAKNMAWMQEHGFDALAGSDKLEVLGLKVVELTSTDWSTLTPAGLNQRLADQGSFPSELKPAAGKLLATYGFRTREGGSGLLQIVAFGKGNFAATVRFKLLARSAGE